MKQGDIWIADLEPVQGSEQGGKRPVVIISSDHMNDALPIVIAVPLSSKIKSYPTAVRIEPSSANGLRLETEALPFQIRTITKGRLKQRIGIALESELHEIIRGLFLVLRR